MSKWSENKKAMLVTTADPAHENNAWETPQLWWEKLNEIYQFNYDLAASPENAKTENYFTFEDNSLVQDWGQLEGWQWLNPPYGRLIKDWVKKASDTILNETASNFKGIIMLIPARTDTKYWHDYIFSNSKIEVQFVRGRLYFEKNGVKSDSAPFPSALVIFKKSERGNARES